MKFKMKSNLNKDTFMYHMLQKSGYYNTLEVFYREPTKIHFIREISREINLAQTSVRKYFKDLLKQGLIKKKKSSPFDGYVANRENESFIYSKRFYNFLSLEKLKVFFMDNYFPKALILFGSYSLGEDVEESDIDLLVISNSKPKVDLDSFEKVLSRKINLIFVKSLNELDKKIQTKIKNGIVLGGFLDG